MSKSKAITGEQLRRFQADFRDRNRSVIKNAIMKNGIEAVAHNPDRIVSMQYTFSHEIETAPITNQKNSGRCWLFAGLNTMKITVAQNCNLKSFELSQTYQMFWDKLEKANYFLESILETREEEVGSRIVSWLLTSPVQDGGQWEMFTNLIEKYGVVPKWIMPETFHSSKSQRMNSLLTVKLREDAARLRGLSAKGASESELSATKEDMMNEIYRMLCHFLGEPPERFDFEYRDKDNQFHRDAGLTPVEFYQKYVGLNLDDYVSVINAPTADKPYDRTYTVGFLGNVKDARRVLYLNVDAETLKQVTLAQLMDNQPVWFGCDVGQMLERDAGIMDMQMYDYEGALATPFAMTKAQRLDYGESCLTHAMVFTGVNVVDGRPNRWKVENSWGEDAGEKGFFIMSDDWFDQFMYQSVVHKKYLPSHLQQVLAEEPVVLPPWDPMGSLAMMR